jgi:hypothetical protein
MIWLRERDGYGILTVRKTDGVFELIRTSEFRSEVLETFARYEDAIKRWNQVEDDVRAKARTRS